MWITFCQGENVKICYTTPTMTEEKNLGGFFTEPGEEPEPVDTTDFTDQMNQAFANRDAAIQNASEISPAYAALLRSITSLTIGGPIATLEKVETALDVHRHEPDLLQGKVAYIGSAGDWQFPFALGAREIDMVDLEFSSESLRESLLASIRTFDPKVTLQGNDVSFFLELESGKKEQVMLHLVAADFREYAPQELGGIIEVAGPTKAYTTEPVTPNIRKALVTGATVLNFDFGDRPTTPNSGYQVRKIGKQTVLQVASQAK